MVDFGVLWEIWIEWVRAGGGIDRKTRDIPGWYAWYPVHPVHPKIASTELCEYSLGKIDQDVVIFMK